MPRAVNPCSYLPRRLQIVASLTLFLLFCVLFLGTSSSDAYDPYLNNVPYGPKLQAGAHQAVDAAHQVVDRIPKVDLPHVNTPNWLNPFGRGAHTPPPEQANSTSGEVSWFSDWKWQNPFSSSITYDEERSVLPPLKERAPIYTYFDPAGVDAKGRKVDSKQKRAAEDILQVWRRAWWAQGFRPVVLGPPEARNNPLYRTLQGLELKAEVTAEMDRWLAWGSMGTGILCNWLAVPMAPYDDPLLSFLRRGEYPALTRYKNLENGLFAGSKDAIEAAIKAAISSPELKNNKTIIEALPSEAFAVDTKDDSIAFYSTTNLIAKYNPIKELLEHQGAAEALAMLPALINSHLHMTWQNTFTSGIAVLKPVPEHTTSVIEPAIEIARNLSQCPSTPIVASCPPNRPKCAPCVSSHPMLISTPPVFRNTSTLYTIATVPHPYTLTSLIHTRDDLNVRFVRRETARDLWILGATKELLGTGKSSFSRLPYVKDAVASEFSESRTLWLTAERPPDSASEKDAEELDWHFGFSLPRSPIDNGKSETPVPGPERRPPPPKQEFGDGPVPSEQQLIQEKGLLEKARMAIRNGARSGSVKTAKATREMVEAWNLADTEAWKFVRAFNARKRIERRKWEEEEEAFLGKGTFGRWIDKITRDTSYR